MDTRCLMIIAKNQTILDRYNDDDYDCIYGYMYGQPYINMGNGEKRPDKIIKIPKQKLILGENKDCFVYIWGYPGPDANIYNFEDYGKTWAFSEEEIEFL